MPPPDRDETLIRALTSPTPEGRALLASISSLELATFLDRPEIQRAIAAREHANLTLQRADFLADLRHGADELRKNIAASTDLANDAQRATHQRASSTLYRTASIAYRATFRTTTSPRGTGVPPVSTPSPASLRALAGSASRVARPGSEALGAIRACSDVPQDSGPRTQDSRPCSPPSPAGHRRGPPASQFPGAREAIADFLRVAGNPQTLKHAFPLVSWYRRTPLKQDGVLKWIESLPAITSHTAADFGPVAYDDEYDLATQHVRLTLPGGTSADALITANVEIDDDLMPARWGINNIAVSGVARPGSEALRASPACTKTADSCEHAPASPTPPSESPPPVPDTS